jgi:archaellum component FlaC
MTDERKRIVPEMTAIEHEARAFRESLRGGQCEREADIERRVEDIEHRVEDINCRIEAVQKSIVQEREALEIFSKGLGKLLRERLGPIEKQLGEIERQLRSTRTLPETELPLSSLRSMRTRTN